MQTSHEKPSPLGIRIPPDLKAWVTEQAKKERRSVNSWLTLLIENAKGLQDAKPQ